jgi:hypothetical protein
MGGLGSGRCSGTNIIEYGLKLDIRRLRRHGILKPGTNGWYSHSWSNGASVTLVFDWSQWMTGSASLRIKYNANGDPVDDCISLEHFAQPFGGYRWCFICPSTNRRCQCLYLPPGAATPRFRSRQAWSGRLLYLSQTLTPECRYYEQARRVAMRVLREGPPEWRQEYVDWDFPPKPPHMRWKTYNRLNELAQKYEDASAGDWMGRVARILARCKK